MTDVFDNTVRVVAASTGTFYGQAMTTGHIYTIAGTTGAGKAGKNGIPAVDAALVQPQALAIDRTGNIFISENGPFRVVAARSGTFYGIKMKTGDIYTPSTVLPETPSIDSAGNLITGGSRSFEVTAARTGHFYGKAMRAGKQYTIIGKGSIKPRVPPGSG